MENIEERLHRLSLKGCRICGFTINNAAPEQQERFLILLREASELEILALTELADTNSITGVWQKTLAEKYRREKKIELHPERVDYFYEQTLPKLLEALPQLSSLKELYLLGVTLTVAQKEQIPQDLKLLT